MTFKPDAEGCPHLKAASQEIAEIVQRYDIGFAGMLIGPDRAEHIVMPDPSWSAITTEGNHLRVRAKRREFDTEEAFLECIERACGLINCLQFAATIFEDVGNALMQTCIKAGWRWETSFDKVPPAPKKPH